MIRDTIIEETLIRPIFNSRGEETVEVEILTPLGIGRSSAPSGASAGVYEAVMFPKGGIREAIKIFNSEIAPELIGLDSLDQYMIDSTLTEIDNTENFSRIGGSVAVATSIANAKAAADTLGIPLFRHLGGIGSSTLPLPLGNVIGGGKHALGRSIDIQEILIVPLNPEDMNEALKINIKIHKEVSRLLTKYDAYFSGGKNDEGAWVTRLSIDKAISIVKEAIGNVSKEYNYDIHVGIGLDIAASTLWEKDKRIYRCEGVTRTTKEHMKWLIDLVNKHGIIYLEDPFHEDDFESFAELRDMLDDILIVGDDLFVTNLNRLEKGIKMKAGNGIIIKPNQVGTLSRAIESLKVAKRFNYTPIISHRSGETEDAMIAHLAVAFEAPLIKTGIVGGERTIKLNELLRIEELLGDSAKMNSLPVKIY